MPVFRTGGYKRITNEFGLHCRVRRPGHCMTFCMTLAYMVLDYMTLHYVMSRCRLQLHCRGLQMQIMQRLGCGRKGHAILWTRKQMDAHYMMLQIRRPTAKQWRGVVCYDCFVFFLFSSPARSFDSGAAPPPPPSSPWLSLASSFGLFLFLFLHLAMEGLASLWYVEPPRPMFPRLTQPRPTSIFTCLAKLLLLALPRFDASRPPTPPRFGYLCYLFLIFFLSFPFRRFPVFFFYFATSSRGGFSPVYFEASSFCY